MYIHQACVRVLKVTKLSATPLHNRSKDLTSVPSMRGQDTNGCLEGHLPRSKLIRRGGEDVTVVVSYRFLICVPPHTDLWDRGGLHRLSNIVDVRKASSIFSWVPELDGNHILSAFSKRFVIYPSRRQRPYRYIFFTKITPVLMCRWCEG